MKLTQSIHTIALLSCIGLAALTTGCVTTDSTAASKFAASVTTVKSQANDALNASAKLTRDEGIAYVATRPTLAEADFAETPTSDIITEWDITLASIESYALNLAALSSPDVTKDFDAAATNLFNQFTQTADRLSKNSLQSSAQTTAGLAAGFSEIAHLILAAHAQASAHKIATATDPQIQKVLNLLADEIGGDHVNPCLRTTVYRTWNTKKDALNESFLTATNQAVKMVVAEQYADIMAKRAAQDESLLGLRRSLLALGDAHHALAQGNDISAQAALTIVTAELQRTHDLFNQFNSEIKK